MEEQPEVTQLHHPSGNNSGQPNLAAPSRLGAVFVIPQYLPSIGGAEMRAHREAIALRSLGHKTRVMTLRWKSELAREETIDDVPVTRAGGRYKRGELRFRAGMQWITEFVLCRELVRASSTYSVIHVRQFILVARAALIASLLTRKPMLVRLGNVGPPRGYPVTVGAATTLYAGALDPDLPCLPVPAGTWTGGDIEALRHFQSFLGLTFWMLRRRKVVFTAISTGMRAYLIQHGFLPEQIVVVPNGIDPDAYSDVAQQNAGRLARTGTDTLAVVCVARHSYEKGIDFLLHAWAHVRVAVPRAHLVLVGGGPLRTNHEGLAEALGIADAVRFVGKADDVRSHLARADLFVLPSRWEGMPNALLEAMACGLPCVATRVSGSEDLIVDGQSGLLVPPEDASALGDAIVALLQDRARARSLGKAARQRVEQHFNEHDIVSRLARLYELVASGRSVAEFTSPQWQSGGSHLTVSSGGLEPSAQYARKTPITEGETA